MNDENELLDYQGSIILNTIESDPLDDLFGKDNQTTTQPVKVVNHMPSPKKVNINKIEQIGTETTSLYMMNNNKYQYDYIVVLNNIGEDGLMDTYLSEANVESEKPRADPSDWFNFGLDEEKWIKLLNKNILMHYERHLLTQDKNTPNTNMPMPMQRMNNMNPMHHPYFYPQPYGMGMRPMQPPNLDHSNMNK
jgi:hypothetical protein